MKIGSSSPKIGVSLIGKITSCIQVLESARNEEELELGLGDFNSVGLADWWFQTFGLFSISYMG